MRPMTAREALEIERKPEDWLYANPDEWSQAARIMDALVEYREADNAHTAYCFGAQARHTDSELQRLTRALFTSESKLAALERGEEPK